MKIKLSPPTKTVFWISVILALAGIVLPLVGISVGSWALVAAYILLVLGNIIKGF